MLLNFIFGKNVRLDYTHHVLHSLKISNAGCICLFSYPSRINRKIIHRRIIELQFFGLSKGIFQLNTVIKVFI